MMASECASESVSGMRLWTRLRCSRCRYLSEHPGPVEPVDLDRDCGLCRAPLGAVTVFNLLSRPFESDQL